MAETTADLTAGFYQLEVLSDSPRALVSLVRHKESGVLCIQKRLHQRNTPYPMLKDRPINGIPQIYAVWETGGDTLVLEELICGENLFHRLEHEGPVDEMTAADWMMQLCRILKQLHDLGVIHRDIKPSNLMVTPEGRLYLIDFDAARLYDAGKEADTVCLGTWGYAAPEQFGYAQTDMRTDIYSMGVVFCQLITGSLPGEAPLRGRLSGILQTCIRLDPAQRYQNAAQVMNVLNMLYWPGKDGAAIRPVSSPVHTALSPVFSAAKEPRRRRGAWRGIVCSIFAALLVYIDLCDSDFALLSDRLIACVEHLWVLMPLLAFAVDLFRVRSRPLFPAFREKKRKKWYYLLYFAIWFFGTAAVAALLSPFYSSEALRIIAAQ